MVNVHDGVVKFYERMSGIAKEWIMKQLIREFQLNCFDSKMTDATEQA